MLLQRISIIGLAALFLVACTSSDYEADRKKNKPAHELYAEAAESLEVGNWKSAIDKLEALDSRFPFGPYSQQAQLDLVYAYYRSGDATPGNAAAERFIRQNAHHPHLDYVYYMKGMINFSAEFGSLKEVLAAPVSERDASTAKKAFDDFAEMLKRFPDSAYANDARQRMIYLRNRLAESEMHAAYYYVKRKAWTAAANRARYVVDHFPGANVTPDALVMLVKCYKALELPYQADEAMKMLKFNYPQRVDETLAVF